MARCRRPTWPRRSHPVAVTGSTAGSSGWPRWIWCASRRPGSLRATLFRRDNQAQGAGADLVGKFGRGARVEIEVDAVLAEPRNLRPAARVGHDMDQAQRGIAEMGDPGLDQ